MDSAWQSDWTTFVKVLTETLRQGATPEDLSRAFGNRAVTWSGVLKEQLIDDLAPLVTIVLPEATIDLKESGTVYLSEQSVPVARDAVVDWQAIPIDTVVTFTAVLGSSQSPFPPVEVKRLSSGRTLVMIRLSDGRPTRNVN